MSQLLVKSDLFNVLHKDTLTSNSGVWMFDLFVSKIDFGFFSFWTNFATLNLAKKVRKTCVSDENMQMVIATIPFLSAQVEVEIAILDIFQKE